jgi:hypothetical protein
MKKSKNVRFWRGCDFKAVVLRAGRIHFQIEVNKGRDLQGISSKHLKF